MISICLQCKSVCNVTGEDIYNHIYPSFIPSYCPICGTSLSTQQNNVHGSFDLHSTMMGDINVQILIVGPDNEMNTSYDPYTGESLNIEEK